MTNVIAANSPTPLQMQERTLRGLNRAMSLVVFKKYENLTDKLEGHRLISQKLLTFVTALINPEGIPMPVRYNNTYELEDYLAKSMAEQILFISNMGNLDPSMITDDLIREGRMLINSLVM